MDEVWIVAIVAAAIVLVAVAIYWMKRGKERRLESKREEAAERRQEAEVAAKRAGESELAARRHMERAEAEKDRAVELDREAAEVDPDRDPDLRVEREAEHDRINR